MSMKDWIDIITSIVSSLIILIGALFAWWKWGREKPQVIRANLYHQVFLAHLDSNNNVLHVTLEIQNKGNVRLKLKSGRTELLKVAPVDEEVQAIVNSENKFAENKTEISWPAFERRTYEGDLLDLVIDSGETEHLYCDFILPKYHKVIALRTQLKFKEEPEIMWPCTTFVNTNDILYKQSSENDKESS
jgi:hypothetical protein